MWDIVYKAYGCEIRTDYFRLAPDGTTFIGDKSTARIRANSAQFYKYVSEGSIQFLIMRYDRASGRIQ